MRSLTQLGFSILQSIKRLRGKKVRFVPTNNTGAPPDHTLWNTLLKKNITTGGWVNYNGFIQDRGQLKLYTELLSDTPPSTNWTKEEQLAYWINAYNAFTVLLVIENYPLKSIKDIAGNLPMINSVWDLKFFKIGTVDFDLNTIEHEILRKQFDEPRIHFAINCASISCPHLRNEAYTASKIDMQLNEQAHHFINNPDNNSIAKNHVQLSKIFDWFKEDFIKNGNLIAFLANYSSVQPNADATISYIPYNWNLNASKD